MKLYKLDYKGKYYILTDSKDQDDEWIGMMDITDITDEWLATHVETCVHYGIPPVVTKNKILKERVDKLLKKYNDS